MDAFVLENAVSNTEEYTAGASFKASCVIATSPKINFLSTTEQSSPMYPALQAHTPDTQVPLELHVDGEKVGNASGALPSGHNPLLTVGHTGLPSDVWAKIPRQMSETCIKVLMTVYGDTDMRM